MKKLLIVGTGGLARELTEWVSEVFEVVGFFSTNREEHGKFSLPGILFSEDLSPRSTGAEYALIAIGLSRAKEKYFDQLKKAGFKFPKFLHSSSLIAKTAVIDDGVIVSPNCTIGSNVRLGVSTFVNFNCGIGHDAQIGRFVQINPGVQIGGFAKVGDGTLVGSGATVLEKINVGRNSTVGSGAVCFAAVADGATVLGNPAKRLPVFDKN
jgi:sugar O-acyltransferase (sialic acid O-acetyltransferase NeuD family)